MNSPSASTGSVDVIPPAAAARRRHPRVAVRELRIVLLDWPLRPADPIALVNLSRSGTALLAREVLGEIGTTLAMSLLDARDASAIPIEGSIRYVIGERGDPTLLRPRWLHGIEFRRIADAEATYLAARIARGDPATD